jgi:hypothetical protein
MATPRSWHGPWRARLTDGRLWVALPAVLILLTVPTALAPTTTVPAVGPGAATPSTTPTCPFVEPETFTSRDVSLAAPTFALASGDSLTSVYEFEVVNSTVTPINVKLTVPSFFAKYPLTGGSSISAYLPPRTIAITNSSWTAASLATVTKVMTGATTFSGSSASMSTEFLAIMGNAAYKTVTLAFRWDWSVTFASNGTKVTSAWSHVSIGGSTPTTFYPAPTVQLVSTSSTTVHIGATFSTYLSGAISGTEFHSVLEYASSGNVMRNTPTLTPPGNSSPALVAVTILPATGPLAPSALLDHVRDVCSALLFSISVSAVYASSANVTVTAQPSSCGPVSFNGVSYASGSKPVVVPSTKALTLSVGTCSGQSFLGWNATNGVSITSGKSASTSATISASGTLTARFT